MEKKFVVAVLDSKYKVFIVHIAALSINLNDQVYSLKNT